MLCLLACCLSLSIQQFTIPQTKSVGLHLHSVWHAEPDVLNTHPVCSSVFPTFSVLCRTTSNFFPFICTVSALIQCPISVEIRQNVFFDGVCSELFWTTWGTMAMSHRRWVLPWYSRALLFFTVYYTILEKHKECETEEILRRTYHVCSIYLCLRLVAPC